MNGELNERRAERRREKNSIYLDRVCVPCMLYIEMVKVRVKDMYIVFANL